ncbi:MAG: DNA polymerase III subunit gamma/tau [Candidatus Eremiobacteraeota bacterium]|nr:DNA polymerase III subunit gamma/tau [Candidatus Eremiobacteraeota bacterium]MCW5866512.1 DNA polymerase III subunit gamma/tau [Candidatus Eremiobacteraeota bacterium]
MSQVSLFRKWRSKAFSDLVGQEAVVKTLRNVLAGGSPARAYLFCGPRGTGKTSTARIFAKALCCENGPALEPCNHCSTCREIAQGNCMDVFEIDAASNTQVEKIRDFIVDKVHFAPAKARFKVYIIDEVHKLSTSSFNALLKTLEEPPAHVVFVLATTHPHELLPTILSRCQRYDFRAFSLTEVEAHLQHIAVEEKLELDPLARQLLARAAQGSMRDALVLLEQAQHYSGGAVQPADVVQMLGLLPQDTLGRWVEALRQGDAALLLGAVEDMHRGGQDFVRAVDLWVDHLRLIMLSKVGAHEAGLSELHEAYRTALQSQAQNLTMSQILNWLRAAVDLQQAIRDGQPPRIALELCLVALCAPPAPVSAIAPGAAAPAPVVATPALEALTLQVQDLQEKVKSLLTAARPRGEQPLPAEKQPAEPPRPAARRETPPPTRAPVAPAAEVDFLGPPREEERIPPARSADAPSDDDFLGPPAEERQAPPPRRESPRAAQRPPAELPNGGKAITQARDFWPHLIQSLKARDGRLQAMMKDAQLREFQPDRLVISLSSTLKFHYEYISRQVRLLEEVSSGLMQSKVRIEVVVDGAQQAPVQEQEHETLVKKASGLFGGRILDAANDTQSD